ncbi:hypothetical protein AAVH_08181 [Aphelenchoides avenae]|nr:hypothetical protein AAVH_08181 [Aphelenchus avenae]
MAKSKRVPLRDLAYTVGEKLLDLAPNLATSLEWDFDDEAVLTLQVSDLSLPAYFSLPSRQVSCSFQEMLHNAVDVFGMHMWRASKNTFYSPVENTWMALRVIYADGFSELEVQMNYAECWKFGDGFPHEIAEELTKEVAKKTHDGTAIDYSYLADTFSNLDYINGGFAEFAENMAAKIAEDIPHPIKMTWEQPQGGCEFAPVIEFCLDTPMP